MTVYVEKPQNRRISPLGVIIGVFIALAVMGWLIFRGSSRPLKPFRATSTPGAVNVNSQPIIVTFEQLNADPVSFRDQRIRITGQYTPLPEPDCFSFSGPDIRWGLISGDLQLNAIGFEEILALVPNGATLTVEGVWIFYDGPFGCGKGSARDQVWYLQVERIIQPNPLPGFDAGPGPAEGLPTTPPLPGEPVFTPTTAPDGQGTAVPTPTLPPYAMITPTITPAAIVTPPPGATATPIPTMVGGPTNTPGAPGTPTATFTPIPTTGPGTPTYTPTGTPTPGAGVTNTPTATQPPFVTSTPGPTSTPGDGDGYPAPTPTSDSYP